MAPRILGLDHVQVSAPPGCEPAARDFYHGVLGLVEIPKPPVMAARGGVWFTCGDTQVHVGVEQDFRPARKAHPAFRLADPAAVHALASRLESRGIPVQWAQDAPGLQRFHASDPWGNRLEFTAPEPPARG